MITELKPGEVFVFGSNLAGLHGAGAAKQALKWGARMGKGMGRYGQTYALPTKGFELRTLPLNEIESFVKIFLHYAESLPKETFLLTAVGCGLAGYSPIHIAPMFKGAPSNVILPLEFIEVLDELNHKTHGN